MLSKESLQQVFGIESIAISPVMLKKQELYRSLMAGRAPWNNADTPSLMLASVVVNETVDEVLNDAKIKIIGRTKNDNNPRAVFLHEQLMRFVDDGLEEMDTNILGEGETVLKPYSNGKGLYVTVCSTDAYAPLAYNARGWLTDVVFTSKTMKQGDSKTLYTLFERHTWNEDAQTHSIVYKAYKSEDTQFGFMLTSSNNSTGVLVPLDEVPEWAHIAEALDGKDQLIIDDMQQPLFVHIRNKAKFKIESPQLQGLPIFAKAVESGALRKLDLQEARTDWEFEGGELAIDAPEAWFHKDETGKTILPERKQRLFRSHRDRTGEDNVADTFSPDLRVDAHGARLNMLRRDVELQTGMSYGIISDNNQQDRTAEEFRSSKKRLINTVMQTQKITGVALDALVFSFNVLIDAFAEFSAIPDGDYELVMQWNESLAADRPREFDERERAQNNGWISQEDNIQWFLDVDEDTAKAYAEELKRRQTEAAPMEDTEDVAQ